MKTLHMGRLHIGICRICRRSFLSYANDHTPMYDHSIDRHNRTYHNIDRDYEMFRFES